MKAENEIRYIFEKYIDLIKDKGHLGEIVFFFNEENIAESFIRRGNMSGNDFQRQIHEVGKNSKPKITLMVGNGQMSIAHHKSKITSIFVQKNPEENKPWEGWEEIW